MEEIKKLDDRRDEILAKMDQIDDLGELVFQVPAHPEKKYRKRRKAKAKTNGKAE